MDVLSLSSPIPSLKLNLPSYSRPKPISFPIFSLKRASSFPRCFQPISSSSSSSPKPQTLSPSLLLASAPQTPATAMRGAESDAMGLLLRERIVFLGSSIDDFVADAIISQLILLDAQDSTKDIKLFINSPGGSLRLVGASLAGGKSSREGGEGISGRILEPVRKDHSLLNFKKCIVCRMNPYHRKAIFCPFIFLISSATMAIYDVVQLVRADVSTVALGIAASTASVILGGGTKGKRFAMPNTRIMIHQPLGGASGQAIDVEIQAREIMHNKNNVTSIIAKCTGRSFEQVQKDIDRDRYLSPIEAVEYGIIDGVIDKDSIIPLVPVPERVKPRISYEEISKDPRKFLTPDVPDDEIY
ncbi:hypothetical protein TIFTF001_033938 [Ficus carica]|uniref:ATP-dependent Clp protease proteolytic subunit n=1 Tax=Ficus carica TaxID=3494 RepID=A0AA88J883_FICCA|nr:hypothetical protein TIFTF001_033938 [Ficus carica]